MPADFSPQEHADMILTDKHTDPRPAHHRQITDSIILMTETQRTSIKLSTSSTAAVDECTARCYYKRSDVLYYRPRETRHCTEQAIRTNTLCTVWCRSAASYSWFNPFPVGFWDQRQRGLYGRQQSVNDCASASTQCLKRPALQSLIPWTLLPVCTAMQFGTCVIHHQTEFTYNIHCVYSSNT